MVHTGDINDDGNGDDDDDCHDDDDDDDLWEQARTEESKAVGEEEPHDTEFLARSHQVAIMMMMVRMAYT